MAAGSGEHGDGLGLGRAARGNAELDMLRRFREAEEYSSKDPTELQALQKKAPPVEGFEGSGIMGQLERLKGAGRTGPRLPPARPLRPLPAQPRSASAWPARTTFGCRR